MFFLWELSELLTSRSCQWDLRLLPTSLTKPRFKLSPRHFVEASTAGRSFTHLVPPTRTTSQSSLYPQNPAKCSAWSQHAKSHLNEGCWHNLIWYRISTVWSAQSVLYFTVITSLRNRPKSFYCAQDQYSTCTPPSLSSLKHILRPIAH